MSLIVLTDDDGAIGAGELTGSLILLAAGDGRGPDDER